MQYKQYQHLYIPWSAIMTEMDDLFMIECFCLLNFYYIVNNTDIFMYRKSYIFRLKQYDTDVLQ